MTPWACGISQCGRHFETAEALIRHQANDHPRCQCKVCGEMHPAGFLAIKHAFDQHTRAEYVRAYDADSDDIRLRERVKELIESEVDVTAVLSAVVVDDEPAVSVSD